MDTTGDQNDLDDQNWKPKEPEPTQEEKEDRFAEAQAYESHEQAAKRARITQQERAQILLEISKALENVADSHKIYQALCLCRDSRLTYEDAQIPEFKIGYKIIKITKDSVSCPSAVVLGKRILQDWIIEKKNAKNAES